MILVFDTETTGLPLHGSAPLEKQPKIIEFGAVLFEPATGTIAEEFNALIHPGEEITAEITKITGITNEDLAGAGTFDATLPSIQRLFKEAGTVIAHNLPFDRSMVKFELARRGITEFPWPPNEICTVGHFRDVWGRNPKLVELYEWSLGRPLKQTHRALDDVKALMEIVLKERVWEQ